MPKMDGYELVELLRGNPSTAALPIIFVSAIFSDEYHHRKGYETGAVDFLSKPFVPEILLNKAQIFLIAQECTKKYGFFYIQIHSHQTGFMIIFAGKNVRQRCRYRFVPIFRSIQ